MPGDLALVYERFKEKYSTSKKTYVRAAITFYVTN